MDSLRNKLLFFLKTGYILVFIEINLCFFILVIDNISSLGDKLLNKNDILKYCILGKAMHNIHCHAMSTKLLCCIMKLLYTVSNSSSDPLHWQNNGNF